MIVGSIVYATKSGLGYLSKLFYDHGIIDKVYIAEHKEFASNYKWYDKKDICINTDDLLENIDTLFIVEAPFPNPFDWNIVQKAKMMGKRVVLMPMYESTPRSHLFLFDKILCPSLLDLEFYRDYDSVKTILPIPLYTGRSLRRSI